MTLTKFILVWICCTNLIACQETKTSESDLDSTEVEKVITSLEFTGNTLETRFQPPEDYERTVINDNSFSSYLRNLKLKPAGTEVKYFDGSVKKNHQVYDAVIDLSIGNKDLHQCADAIMRLRAEYLWSQKKYDEIHFNFTNGFKVEYLEWMKGKRMIINGNQTYWDEGENFSNTYQDFWEYLELIFMYAGTSSLSKELKAVNYSDMQIGDVFIIGGFPGHAVIVVDMAINQMNSQKVYLLAQSYMPAQELQILKNPMNEKLSPWYTLDDNMTIQTPEWNFSQNNLKRFQK